MSMNVMELYAKIGLDRSGFNKGLDAAKNSLMSFGSSIAKMGTTAMKVTGAALGAAASGVVAITKASVAGYAQYEQMAGGIKKIFGTGTQTLEEFTASFKGTAEEARAEYEKLNETSALVLKNADKAWKTAGMSANEYMQTVTGISGALMSSLDYDKTKAAEYADRAMSDMSDIANTYGYSLDQVATYYTSFSRGLYQTLDTLTAGAYKGTKEGAYELINSMAELKDIQEELGITVEKDNLDYANFVNAMSVYNKKIGITGTTLAEASNTIQGSFNMLGSAWQNLVMGFSNPDADLDSLIGNVVESFTAVATNLVPTITRALGGIGTAIEQIAPVIGDNLVPLIENLLPSLLSAATTLVQSFSDALPSLIKIISDQLPSILETVIPVAISAMQTIFESIAQVLPQLLEVVEQNIGIISDGLLSIMTTIGSIILELLPTIANIIVTWLPKLMDFIQKNMSKITSGLSKVIKIIGSTLLKLAPTILPMVVQLAVELIKSFTEAFSENSYEIISGIMEVMQVIIETLTNPETLNTIFFCGLQILQSMITGIANNSEKLTECIRTLIVNIITFLNEAVPELIGFLVVNASTIITDVLPAILTGIGEAGADIILKISDEIGSWLFKVTEGAKAVFEGIGKGMLEAWAYIWEKLGTVGEWILDKLKTALSGIVDIGKNLMKGLWNGIESMGSWIKDKVEGIGSSILGGIKSVFGISSPSKKTAEFGRYLMDGLAIGVEDESDSVFNRINSVMKDGLDNLSLSSLGDSEFFGFDGTFTTNKPTSKTSDSTDSKLDKIIELLYEIIDNGGNTFPIIVGGKEIDEVYIDSRNRITTRSGGRVSV